MCYSNIKSHNLSTVAAAVSSELDSGTTSAEVSQIFLKRPRDSIENAKPFSHFLTDTYQRQHDYLRISLTEKCNLRCVYCMPEEGVPQSRPAELLTSHEIFLLSSIFVSQGVSKIRLTGGEPTIRPDIIPLMQKIGSLRSQGLRELCLTTNGLTLRRKLDSMVEAGLTGVNLSLDTLDPWQFQIMTRRQGLAAVLMSIDRILEMNKLGAGIKLKINCVVMRGMNEQEIIPFVEMGREKDLEVRFIEYMPFDGNKWSQGKMLSYQEMLDMIRKKYPDLRKVQDQRNDTSKTYKIPGFAGKIGFITSMTHNFCGTCNRLRITSDGNLKVCLFGNAEVSLRDVLRRSNNGKPIDEKSMPLDSMGQDLFASKDICSDERELLDVIGMAVKRKKEKHAGMGELENMKNRPMILIDHENNFEFGAIAYHDRSSLSVEQSRSSEARGAVPYFLLPSNSYPALTSTRLYSTSRSNASTSPQLTHVTQTGSAHMVPISHKASTSRTAVAVCSVHFTSPLPIRLIQENNNKKGDVLGVARIAGIMAAKRTSELVPLCHPVAICFVGVELEINEGLGGEEVEKKWPERKEEEEKGRVAWAGTGQGDAYPWYGSSSEKSVDSLSSEPVSPEKPCQDSRSRKGKGSINITATVSCDGKTGVEMEALTAASVAALTVYDMCKAVDKEMRIEGLRVVKKEGGKSGTWASS